MVGRRLRADASLPFMPIILVTGKAGSKDIVAGGVEDTLRTHRREVTVVFLDLRGFTAFAETSEPEEVMGVLRECHAEMGKLILEHEGTLERFAGDGMMIFFNDPVLVPNPAERAIRMAVAMRERMGELIAYALGVQPQLADQCGWGVFSSSQATTTQLTHPFVSGAVRAPNRPCRSPEPPSPRP